MGSDARPEAVACWVAIGAPDLRQKEVELAFRATVRRSLDRLEQLLQAVLEEERRTEDQARELAAGLMATVFGCYQLAVAAHAAPTRLCCAHAAAHGRRADRSTDGGEVMTEAYGSERFALVVGDGRRCVLRTPHVPGLRDYHHVLSVEGEGALSTRELEDLSVLAQRVGRALALRRFGHEECYSLIYNAGRTRRKPWPHVHIVLASSTLAKRRAFFMLKIKHLLRLFAAHRPRTLGSCPWARANLRRTLAS